MVTGGTDLATVKEILGQASIEMTVRYAHPTTEGEMRAVSTIEKQMENLDKHHQAPKQKVTSMQIVVNSSSKRA